MEIFGPHDGQCMRTDKTNQTPKTRGNRRGRLYKRKKRKRRKRKRKLLTCACLKPRNKTDSIDHGIRMACAEIQLADAHVVSAVHSIGAAGGRGRE